MDIKTVHYGRKTITQYKCPQCNRYHFETDENPFCDEVCKNKHNDKVNDEYEFKGHIQKSHSNYKRFKQRYRISKKVRFEVFERDNYTCIYCNRKLGEDITSLVIEHLEPYVYNQQNDIKNLVTSCVSCNHIKHSIIFKNIEQCKEYLYRTSKAYRKYYKPQIAP